MASIRLNAKKLELKRKELGWTKGKLAKRIGVTQTTLHRASLNPNNSNYDGPGEKLISGILNLFPGSVFEEYFFLD